MRHDDTDAPPAAVCRVGGHKHPGTGHVCDRHLQAMRTQLAGVARMTGQLPTRLVLGTTPAGDKVSTTRDGSPAPGNGAVLNMLGPGGAEVRRDARMLSPLVRRWSTTRTVEVRYENRGKPVVETRTVRDWHTEPVTTGPALPATCNCGRHHLDRDGQPITRARPLLVLDNDQIGRIPPAEWLDMWVRRWRLTLRHTTTPIKGHVDLACDADQRHRLERARIGESLRAARQAPTLMPAVAQLITIQRAYRDYLTTASTRVRMVLLGVHDDGPEHQARVAAALTGRHLPTPGDPHTFQPVHDSVTAEWDLRYGYAGVAAAVEVDARYLADWLELAADHDDGDPTTGLSAFATELRAVHSELEHVLGETGDEIWLGRCPAHLRDTAGDDTDQVCGAGLRQDPYRTRTECPRCHTTWPESDWMRLAHLIRITWPIDRRRRYTQGDKAAAEKCVDRLPKCRGCEKTMTVEWAETTARRDRTRTWSPTGYRCPSGCISGGTTVAAA